MPTTPGYGWPYPAGTDRVMDGDNAIGALGQAIENSLKALNQALTVARPISSAPDFPLTTAAAIVPGATFTFTAGGGETLVVIAQFDFNITVAGATGCVGQVFLDGVALNGACYFVPGAAAVARQTTPLLVISAGLAAGARTVDLRANKSAAGGTAVAGFGNTRALIWRIPSAPTLLGGLDQVESLPAAELPPG
jgi:hypothetical protein